VLKGDVRSAKATVCRSHLEIVQETAVAGSRRGWSRAGYSIAAIESEQFDERYRKTTRKTVGECQPDECGHKRFLLPDFVVQDLNEYLFEFYPPAPTLGRLDAPFLV
jgi:hypothetical protein